MELLVFCGIKLVDLVDQVAYNTLKNFVIESVYISSLRA